MRRALCRRAVGDLRAHSTIDWDGGVPEQWSRIWGKDGRMAVMLCLPLPLVIVTEDAGAQLDTQLRSLDLTVIKACAWAEQLFSVEPDVLKRAFNLASISQAMDPPKFSIDELWYSTVTG
jgi:hypothetical protein